MPRAQRIAGQKQAKRLNNIGRQVRMMKLLQKREPLLPTSLLKALAASGLPPHKNAYNEKLRELLGST